MPSTNGHGPKRAVLYARVSTDEQARSGFSLAQQLEALREYAAREGHEVLEEVADRGQSGASLERPGMDRVRNIVAAGGAPVDPERGHHYYRCPSRLHDSKDACAVSKNFRADNVEPMVWNFVSGLLRDPERVQAGLETMIEREREGLRGDPDSEAKVWLDKLAEADEERRGYQRLAAKGLMTDEELDGALVELEETYETARRELETLSHRRDKMVELERDKEALLESYAGMVPEALDGLAPEERHQIYKMLRLRVVANVDARIEAAGTFGDLD